MSTGIPIAQAADRLGLSVDTLRYYEKDDLLLRRIPRSTSGHRRYEEIDLTWIELLTRLRATGMTIRDIRRYAALVRAGTGNEGERLDLLHEHRTRVLAQLAEVSAHLRAIDHKIDVYESRLARPDVPA